MPLPAISTPFPLPHEREHEQTGAMHHTHRAASADAITNPDRIQMDDAPLARRSILIDDGTALSRHAKPETHMNMQTINELTIYGAAPHVAASFEDDGGHAGHHLDACPFCGSSELALLNTHTPYYWIECEGCGAEAHGEIPDGGGGKIHTREECIELHRLAMASAVAKWNARPLATPTIAQSARERPSSFQRVLDELDAIGADTRPDLAPLTKAIRAYGNSQYDPLWMNMDVAVSPDMTVVYITPADVLRLRIANTVFASLEEGRPLQVAILDAIVMHCDGAGTPVPPEVVADMALVAASAAIVTMGDATTSAARDVLAERTRQVNEEGWTPEHDDDHVCDEIAALAAFYAMPRAARYWNASSTGYGNTMAEAMLPHGWVAKDGERRRELVKAGALILAEIERLDRAAIVANTAKGDAK